MYIHARPTPAHYLSEPISDDDDDEKDPTWRSRLKKDPGIPNLFPYKERILHEIEEKRRLKEEEAMRRREGGQSKKQKSEGGGEEQLQGEGARMVIGGGGGDAMDEVAGDGDGDVDMDDEVRLFFCLLSFFFSFFLSTNSCPCAFQRRMRWGI